MKAAIAEAVLMLHLCYIAVVFRYVSPLRIIQFLFTYSFNTKIVHYEE